MSGALVIFLGQSGFVASTQIFTSGSGTVTIPVGATTMILEALGASGNGGSGFTSGCLMRGGGGGGSGGYAKSVLTVSSNSGQTINYSVGAPGSATTFTSGTFTLPGGTITANSGANGVNATSGGNGGGGAGGTASGGNTTNTTGNAGIGGVVCTGGTGGAGLVGTFATGIAGGHGGAGGINTGFTSGGSGKIVFNFA